MSETATRFFEQHLRQSAAGYFPDWGEDDLDIQLVRRRSHSASTIYVFELYAPAQQCSEQLLVKTLARNSSAQEKQPAIEPELEQRPRLTSVLSTEKKVYLEHTALSAIEAYFNCLADPRFGKVRVLDFLPEYQAIVMMASPDPSLRRLIWRSSRFRFPTAHLDLSLPFSHAGAWLRAYHTLPKRDQVEIRHNRRTDFIQSITDFTGFLAKKSGDENFFDRVAARTTAAAEKRLPDLLPLGLGHGDYALRNILVGPNNRVTVIDTRANWRIPIYEDMARFLIGFKMSQLQVFSQGLALGMDVVNRYEKAFLTGYFGEEAIPYEQIRLYEIQILLNKWSFIWSRLQKEMAGRLRITGEWKPMLRLALTNRFFRRHIESMLNELGS